MINENWLGVGYFKNNVQDFPRVRINEVFVHQRLTNQRLAKMLPGFPKRWSMTIDLSSLQVYYPDQPTKRGQYDLCPLVHGESAIVSCFPTLRFCPGYSLLIEAQRIIPYDDYGRVVPIGNGCAWLRGLMFTMYCSAHHGIKGKESFMLDTVKNGLYRKALAPKTAEAIAQEKAKCEHYYGWARELTKQRVEKESGLTPEAFELQACVILQEFIDWYDEWDSQHRPVKGA